MQITQYRKAIVPVAVGFVLALLASLGLTASMTVKDIITLLITSGAVYLVPNSK